MFHPLKLRDIGLRVNVISHAEADENPALTTPRSSTAGGRIKRALRREALYSTCALALLIGGCSKRQAPPRIVYTPAPPAAAAPASTEPSPTMVIEEPPPPAEPVQVSTPEATPDKTTRPRRRVLRTEPPAVSTEPPEAPETPPAEVPALEPRESSAQETALRRQIQALQEDVRGRLARIKEAKLSEADRKTLEDARTFFAQSNRALEEGDLQRALNLARKASLLAAALEQ